MHELSIATSIVEMAEKEARTRGVRVRKIFLKIGPLSGVVKEALAPAFEMAVEGTSLEGAGLVIEDVPLIAYCPTCRANVDIDPVQWFCCPVCSTPTPDVVQGTELEVTALEVE